MVTIIIIIAISTIAAIIIKTITIKVAAKKAVKKAMANFAKEIDCYENTISAADLGITIEKESMFKTFCDSVRKFFLT